VGARFGIWNFAGRPADLCQLDRSDAYLAAECPKASHRYVAGSLAVLNRDFHPAADSQTAIAPQISESGVTVFWDGRLDDRANLIHQLGGNLSHRSADGEIVAAAYDRWRCDCFAKLLGDWAVAIFDSREDALVLAKDFAGSRPLYYATSKSQAVWSNALECIVPYDGERRSLNLDYLAGWMSSFPSLALTPYVGIHSVPPCSYVLVRRGEVRIHKYWDFNPEARVEYRTDREYEECFLALFSQSVERRLRSDAPVLAELSGGMDSSAIVCVADDLARRKGSANDALQTVSFFSNDEPDWDERPYFEAVERKRGRTGFHIDVAGSGNFRLGQDSYRFPPTPACSGGISTAETRLAEIVKQNGFRVLLSGLGGDEVLGGVPTPVPELADLLVAGRISQFFSRAYAWSFAKRKPVYSILTETLREFLPIVIRLGAHRTQPPAWLEPAFAKRLRRTAPGYASRLQLTRIRPSFQQNLEALEVLRAQVASSSGGATSAVERRYPYLDRDLLRFLYAIPREQILRPGERRSLMRRALAGIVPKEVLERRRKAFAVRGPVSTIASQAESVRSLLRTPAVAALGMVNEKRLFEAVKAAERGEEVALPLLIRTLIALDWVASAERWGVLKDPRSGRTAGTTLQPRPTSHAESRMDSQLRKTQSERR
jgi:asparagine synthase (glutamine-hydrolysing)